MLLAGWFLVLSALVLLGAAWPQAAFILAGIAVEVFGLGMVSQSHVVPHGRQR